MMRDKQQEKETALELAERAFREHTRHVLFLSARIGRLELRCERNQGLADQLGRQATEVLDWILHTRRGMAKDILDGCSAGPAMERLRQQLARLEEAFRFYRAASVRMRDSSARLRTKIQEQQTSLSLENQRANHWAEQAQLLQREQTKRARRI